MTRRHVKTAVHSQQDRRRDEHQHAAASVIDDEDNYSDLSVDNEEDGDPQLTSGTSSTVKSLPSELILVILDMAAPPGCVSKQQTRQRYNWLLSTSFVSRQFCQPSQALLYSSITIHNATTANRWLSSPLLGLYATRQLDLVGVHSGTGLSGTTAMRIINKAVGIRWLRLSDFKRLSSKCLASDSLRYLDTLIIQTSFPDKDTVIEMITFPFRLKTLSVFNRAYSPLLLSKLLEASQGCLTTLELSMNHSSIAYEGLLQGFENVASSLERLLLHHKPSNEFMTLLHLCGRRLTQVQCHHSIDVGQLLDSLNQDEVRIRSLQVGTDFNTVETLTLLGRRMFDSGSASSKVLEELQRLRIMGIGEYELYMMGQRKFVEQVQDRGIKLELEGGPVSSDWVVQMSRSTLGQ
ncbi:hypothetical protein OIO90_006551 [Microbotryomycetes sp. JL221]|nr:hypothetical protein OIO90_006551 [Microbotryomycetes sp. JL221]